MEKILPRFSIRALMLATLILAMALSIVVLLWELIPLRAEVQQLRNEAGYLTIDDPSKIHAIRLESDSPLVWRWKVWVPKGRGTIRVNSIVGNIPALNDYGALRGGIGIDQGIEQELVVSVAIYQSLRGTWELSCEIGGSGTRKTLTEEQVAAIRDKGGSCREGVGRSTVASDDSNRLVLLRERFVASGTGTIDSRSLETAGDGMLVWLQVEDRP